MDQLSFLQWFSGKEALSETIYIPIGSMGLVYFTCIGSFLNGKSVNVGKYTSSIDPMGNIIIPLILRITIVSFCLRGDAFHMTYSVKCTQTYSNTDFNCCPFPRSPFPSSGCCVFQGTGESVGNWSAGFRGGGRQVGCTTFPRTNSVGTRTNKYHPIVLLLCIINIFFSRLNDL